MEIIFCHHAQRDRSKFKGERQKQDITALGEQDAQVFAQMMKNSGKTLTAVYTSAYLRCKRTAQIVNSFSNAPIFEEERFNEFNNAEETWTQCQKRIIAAICDITQKHNDDDVILCVTSGVNLGAFICWAYGIEPSENTPFLGIVSCSPIIFTYQKED